MANTRTITKIHRTEVNNVSDGMQIKFYGLNSNGKETVFTVNMPYSYTFRSMMNRIKMGWAVERSRQITFINETDAFTLKP